MNRPHVGNPTETSIYELAKIINRLAHKEAGIWVFTGERVPTDPHRRCPDISRAIELLGWSPKID